MPTVKSSTNLVEVEYNSLLVPAALAVFSIFLIGAAVLGSDGFGQAACLTLAACFCAFAAAVFREKSHLRVDTDAGVLSFSWAGFWKKSLSLEMPLRDLKGIRTEVSRGTKGTRAYRTCLVAATGVTPLTKVFSSAGQSFGTELHRLLSDRGLKLAHEERDYDVSTLVEYQL
jgi:hypothetical protein